MLILTLTAIAWFCVGWIIRDLGPQFLTLIKKYKSGEYAVARRADPSKTCKLMHSWVKSYQNDGSNSYEKHVCRACGLIQGTDKVISERSIEKIEEINSAVELENKLFDEFVELEDSQIKKYFASEIAAGVSFYKLQELHTHALTFEKRFSAYKITKKFDMSQYPQKSNA